jgi:hypothetical protein
MIDVICPVCAGRARTVDTQYGFRHSCCGLWSWDYAPLVDEETHEARKAAHAAFDPLWRKHGFSRSQAYSLLAAKLGIKRKKCHMKVMSSAVARRVPGAVAEILASQDIILIE